MNTASQTGQTDFACRIAARCSTGTRPRSRSERPARHVVRCHHRVLLGLSLVILLGHAPSSSQAAGVPNDPLYPVQTWTRTVNLEAAWAITTGNSRAVIAVLDTGVDATLPDLAGRVLPGYDATSGGTDTTDRSANRHGTTVALIAAGRGNDGVGGAGAAWGAQVLPVRCLDAEGNGTANAVADGVHWAVDHGATVINLSVTASSAPFALVLSQQLAYAHDKHIPVVVAAGEGRDAITYPANDASVITVGATDASGATATIADFSPRRVKADVLAPGVDVAVASAFGRSGEGTRGTGTSFSSAIVAGTIALMQSARADLRPEEMRDILMRTARPVAGSVTGQLDAGKALGAVLTLPTPLPALPAPAYRATYDRNDAPVQTGNAARGYTWGPETRADLIEPYAESADAQRHVWYFDKGRLEQNDRASGEVTSGLLVTEMVTGRIQTGRDQFVPRDAATVPVVGDFAASPSTQAMPSVSYATLGAVRQLPPRPSGTLITESLAPNSSRTAAPQTTTYSVTTGSLVRETNHAVASVFTDYLNSTGTVRTTGTQTTSARLFDPPYFVVGLPITEAYWVTAMVGGKSKIVLVQAFERRVLTYTPDNPEGFRVEMGNVGLHYLAWRYG